MLRRAALLAHRAAGSSAGVEGCWTCLARQLQPELLSSSADSRHAWRRDATHGFTASSWPGAKADSDDEALPANERVKQLAEEIMHLNLLEVADLTDILQKRLNIPAPSFGGMPMMGGPMPGAAPAAVPAADAAPAEAAAEKTEFDVKLEGFDAAAKIKVIKEIRAVTELGLKEAKELVEKAPVVVKAGLKKEEAEELKKKLEAVGGKVAVE